jgi:hypothetical protein
VAALAVTLIGCDYLDPDREAITARPLQLTLASEDVGRLVAKQVGFASQEQAEVDRFHRDLSRLDLAIKRPATDGRPTAAAAIGRSELKAHPERYIPERTAFLNAMARLPSVLVPAGSHCRIVEMSEAICSYQPTQNPKYVRVVVTSGPSKGLEGWGCLGDGIGLTRTMY